MPHQHDSITPNPNDHTVISYPSKNRQQTSEEEKSTFTEYQKTNHVVSIRFGIPIGRIELIEACIKSCRTSDRCRICHSLKSAARFLSKEMLVFTEHHSSKQQSDNQLVMHVKKCGKLIRINNNSKVEESVPYTVGNGSILSLLLPLSFDPHTSVTGNPDPIQPNTDKSCVHRLVIKFAIILMQGTSSAHAYEASIQSSPPFQKISTTEPILQNHSVQEKWQQSQEQQQQHHHHEQHCDDDEYSPALSLPIDSEIHRCVPHGNSFESNLSAGFLTLQESKSTLSQLDKSTQHENVLLSSLTKQQVSLLIKECDDSEKGRFRKMILEMALRDGSLPPLLKSTCVRLCINQCQQI